MTTIYSPLEQFIILPAFSSQGCLFKLLPFDSFFITGALIVVFLTSFFFNLIVPKTFTIAIIPTVWTTASEYFLQAIELVLKENIQFYNRDKFVPILGTIFLTVLTSNILGLIPFSYTLTSQLIATFTIGLGSFIGIQIIGFQKNKIKAFSAFFPSGVSILLSFLLVPIEFISFIFKPVSLAIRLFANMMAGHTLLKVIAGFIWLIAGSAGAIALLSAYVPFALLVILFFLETAVAAIQSFVFVVLICLYINDIYNLH